MAGTKKRNAWFATFDKLEDEIMDRIAAGESVNSICRELNINSRNFYFWLKRKRGRREDYDEAKRVSAGVFEDKATEAVENVEKNGHVEAARVQLAGVQRTHYEWMAKVRDPSYEPGKFGGGSVVVNIGGLHLDALKAAQATKQIDAGVEEAEWEEAGELQEEDEDPVGDG